jgi:hypothetical protein
MAGAQLEGRLDRTCGDHSYIARMRDEACVQVCRMLLDVYVGRYD